MTKATSDTERIIIGQDQVQSYGLRNEETSMRSAGTRFELDRRKHKRVAVRNPFVLYWKSAAWVLCLL